MKDKPRISADDWTDEEWFRVMQEISPETDPVVAEQAVAKWRSEDERKQ